MTQDSLVNCKKCGTLFFKNSSRDICERCFQEENDEIDKIKRYVNSQNRNVEISDIVENTGFPRQEIEDLISRKRIFSILSKINIRCKLCSSELDDSEKSQFVCKKCALKFSPKLSSFDKKRIDILTKEKAKKLQRRLRGGMNVAGANNKYGFIQNYDL